MLVLSFKRNERYVLVLPDGREVWIQTTDIRGDKTRQGISAPKDVKVFRECVYEAMKESGELPPTIPIPTATTPLALAAIG